MELRREHRDVRRVVRRQQRLHRLDQRRQVGRSGDVDQVRRDRAAIHHRRRLVADGGGMLPRSCGAVSIENEHPVATSRTM
jgi:hypothetical protein